LLACNREHCIDAFDILVNSTLDLNVRNNQDRSALEISATRNFSEYVTKLLATARVDVLRENKSGQTAFSLAAQSPFVKRNILELLYAADPCLAVRADASSQRLTPLHHVSRLHPLEGKQADKTKYLLSLPEVDTLVQKYFEAEVQDKLEQLDKLFQFASLHSLAGALAALTKYGASAIVSA
jgi:ankyrin repeat protein